MSEPDLEFDIDRYRKLLAEATDEEEAGADQMLIKSLSHGAVEKPPAGPNCMQRQRRTSSGFSVYQRLDFFDRQHDRWPDDIRLSDIEDRFICTACGKRGADVRGDPIGTSQAR